MKNHKDQFLPFFPFEEEDTVAAEALASDGTAAGALAAATPSVAATVAVAAEVTTWLPLPL